MLINNIFIPIHDILYSSKKDGYKLYHIVQIWKQIPAHLNICSINKDQNLEVQILHQSVFDLWYQKQVMDIHLVEYFLRLLNHQVTDVCLTLKTHFAEVLICFFKRYEVD